MNHPQEIFASTCILVVSALALIVVTGPVAAQALSGEARVCQELSNKKQYDQAFARCLKAANEGDAASQLTLAKLYENGQGTDQDKALAHAWNLRAAKLGNAKGQARVARMYREGIGTKVDDARARLWQAQADKNRKTH